jgi:hypothetical protein
MLAFIAPQEQVLQKISHAQLEPLLQVEEPLQHRALMELLVLISEKVPLLVTQLFADLQGIIVPQGQLPRIIALLLVKPLQTEQLVLHVRREVSALLEQLQLSAKSATRQLLVNNTAQTLQQEKLLLRLV